MKRTDISGLLGVVWAFSFTLAGAQALAADTAPRTVAPESEICKGCYQKYVESYAFERYRFHDIGYDNFRYIVFNAVVPSLLSTSYLSGQSAFQNYTANIFYPIGTYKF